MSCPANVASANEWETWCGVLYHATGSFKTRERRRASSLWRKKGMEWKEPISQERRMWEGLMLISIQNHSVVKGFMLIHERGLCTDYYIRFSILCSFLIALNCISQNHKNMCHIFKRLKPWRTIHHKRAQSPKYEEWENSSNIYIYVPLLLDIQIESEVDTPNIIDRKRELRSFKTSTSTWVH